MEGLSSFSSRKLLEDPIFLSRSRQMERCTFRIAVFIGPSYNANNRRVSTLVCIVGKRLSIAGCTWVL